MNGCGLDRPRVVIIGGGPAGAAAALSLARTGLAPVVLETQPEPQLKVGECLPPSVNPLLRRLGIVENVSRAALTSHGNRFAWGSAQPLERDFIFGPAGMGWHLDRRKFEEELAVAAIQAGADWRYGRRLVRSSPEAHGGHRLEVKAEKGLEVYRADFVIDASGRAARFSRLLGRRPIRYDRLVGVAAYYQTDSAGGRHPEDTWTLIEAVEEGWWYSTRLPGQKLIAIYMTDADLLRNPPPRRADGWRVLLEAASQTRQRIRQCGDPAFPAPRILGAQTSRLSAVAGPEWLAAGDAAIAYDPLTSHGITTALESGTYAGTAATDYLGGRREALHDYASLIDRAFAQYLILHHDRYLAEQRWPDSTFWRRRHMRADP